MAKYTIRKKMALAAQLASLAVEISCTTKADVFVEYSAHVDWLEVRIFPDGWNEERYNPEQYTIWFNEYHATDREAKRVLAALERLKQEAE